MNRSDTLVEIMKRGGVCEGDLLLIHSSFSPIKMFFESPMVFLEEVLNYLGPEGTLLIPTFNFTSWTGSHYFDILETPSEMGIVTEIARIRKDGRRTKHPIYSFMVFGKLQKEFMACDDQEAFGNNSIFALFHKLNGHIMSVALNFNSSFSLQHYVEIKAGITYRRIKEFSGIYIDTDRTPRLKSYSMFVRAQSNFITNVTPGLEILQRNGIIRDVYFNGIKIDFCRENDFYNNVYRMVISNPELFYEKGK
jgi:aminoglycoside 3-N-acetyltransferase